MSALTAAARSYPNNIRQREVDGSPVKGHCECGHCDQISPSRQDDPPEGQLAIRKWHFLASRLPGQLAIKSVGGLSTRRFIEAVLWIAATDSTWPQLPKSYGNFHAVYQRFARWARLDVWDYVSTCLEGDPRLPALQRLVRQHLEIRRRRNKPVEQAPVGETIPLAIDSEGSHP